MCSALHSIRTGYTMSHTTTTTTQGHWQLTQQWDPLQFWPQNNHVPHVSLLHNAVHPSCTLLLSAQQTLVHSIYFSWSNQWQYLLDFQCQLHKLFLHQTVTADKLLPIHLHKEDDISELLQCKRNKNLQKTWPISYQNSLWWWKFFIQIWS